MTGAAGATPFAPPGPRELRAQSVKRLQIGLFGLATMLLLVALANVIMERARLADSGGAAASVNSAADPLADLGVIPGGDSDAARARAARHNPNR